MSLEHEIQEFSASDLEDLRAAKQRLDSPSFTAELASLVGQPIESLFRSVPKSVFKQIDGITHAALLNALKVSSRSLTQTSKRGSRDTLHKWLGAGSGALGGALGLWALPVELPVSTTLILRSIADIARSEGHDISSLEVQLACMEVFALGGTTEADNATESGYWVVRASLTKVMSDAAGLVAKKGAVTQAAPPLVRLVEAIASRFGVTVTAQAAARALPIISAITGAAINVLFMNHFQKMARGHFIVKRLEKKYGSAAVEQKYKELIV
jgi:hypothetical protein